MSIKHSILFRELSILALRACRHSYNSTRINVINSKTHLSNKAFKQLLNFAVRTRKQKIGKIVSSNWRIIINTVRNKSYLWWMEYEWIMNGLWMDNEWIQPVFAILFSNREVCEAFCWSIKGIVWFYHLN